LRQSGGFDEGRSSGGARRESDALDEVSSFNRFHFPSPLLGPWPGFAPAFSTAGAGREIDRKTVPTAVQTVSAVVILTLKKGCTPNRRRVFRIPQPFLPPEKYPGVGGSLISRPGVD
jgi:hypothetical protein